MYVLDNKYKTHVYTHYLPLPMNLILFSFLHFACPGCLRIIRFRHNTRPKQNKVHVLHVPSHSRCSCRKTRAHKKRRRQKRSEKKTRVKRYLTKVLPDVYLLFLYFHERMNICISFVQLSSSDAHTHMHVCRRRTHAQHWRDAICEFFSGIFVWIH